MAIFKMTEWEDTCGKWRCNDVSNLGKDSSHWTHPARILDMNLVSYIQWVYNNFNPEIDFSKEKCLVFFSWKNQKDMRKFKNYINAKAREKNYQI